MTQPLNKLITALIVGLGVFHLIAPKELQDKYAIDVLLGHPQKQCMRHIAGGILLLLGFFLNTKEQFKLINLPKYSLLPPAPANEKFMENYANFPDYETFIV